MAGMNSLTSYRGLGKTGMRVLQAGLLLKSLIAAILWACCLYSWGGEQLPKWTHLEFRQPRCFETTAIVSFFVPLRHSDPDLTKSKVILGIYSAFWAIIMILGSYWSFRAPVVLRHRGGFLNSKPRRNHISKRFLITSEQLAQHRRDKEMDVDSRKRDPGDYTPSSTDEDTLLISTMRSLPKRATSISRKDGRLEPPVASDLGSPNTRSAAGPTEKNLTDSAAMPKRLAAQHSAQAWTEREIEIRHHFIIWPAVAVLLVFTILTVELQTGLNDVFAGEWHFDFPGKRSISRAARWDAPNSRKEGDLSEYGSGGETEQSAYHPGRRPSRARSAV
ncbi:hypothetical protein OIV83_004134 [Microbotryomycetes sp. JL201]|nr:hypothetical protein OIV83_004134 [Microbotryomycetes sp. JL201]